MNWNAIIVLGWLAVAIAGYFGDDKKDNNTDQDVYVQQYDDK